MERRPLQLVLILAMTSLLVTSRAETRGRCGVGDGVVVRGGQRQSDGSLLAEDGTSFPPGCYWKSKNGVISGCPDKFHPCLWKFCPQHQAMREDNTCYDSNNTLLSTFQPPPNGTFDFAKFDLVHGVPCFLQSFELTVDMDHMTINENGSLAVDRPDDDDDFFMSGGFFREVLEDGVNSSVVVFGCFTEDDDPLTHVEKPKLKFLINSIAVMISMPFLVATLVVYAVIPELRNLHGKCLMSHVASLCVTFPCLGLIQLGVNLLSTPGCIAAGMIAYCFFLASFLWLNVMCFDIWWTFSGYRNRLGLKDPRDSKKFAYYSLYAWGAAFVFLCVCLTMQFKEDVPEQYLRPNIGEYNCWFYGEAATWAYFNGPIAVLLLCNLMLFAHTALNLWTIKKQTAILNEGKDSTRSTHRETSEIQFKLYLKLFIVMGVPWTMEIISSAVGGPDYIWWLTDLANLLVGIPIFIIFVWKSKVRQVFLAKLNIKMGSSADTSAYELT